MPRDTNQIEAFADTDTHPRAAEVAICDGMLRLIGKRENWCRGELAHQWHGVMQYCAIGALNVASGGAPNDKPWLTHNELPRARVFDRLESMTSKEGGLMMFNDRGTHRKVRALITRARASFVAEG